LFPGISGYIDCLAKNFWMAALGSDRVETQDQCETGGTNTTPHLPIAALRASGGVSILQDILQPVFSHSLGRSPPFSELLFRISPYVALRAKQSFNSWATSLRRPSGRRFFT
jgi:hypothetical protein